MGLNIKTAKDLNINTQPLEQPVAHDIPQEWLSEHKNFNQLLKRIIVTPRLTVDHLKERFKIDFLRYMINNCDFGKVFTEQIEIQNQNTNAIFDKVSIFDKSYPITFEELIEKAKVRAEEIEEQLEKSTYRETYRLPDREDNKSYYKSSALYNTNDIYSVIEDLAFVIVKSNHIAQYDEENRYDFNMSPFQTSVDSVSSMTKTTISNIIDTLLSIISNSTVAEINDSTKNTIKLINKIFETIESSTSFSYSYNRKVTRRDLIKIKGYIETIKELLTVLKDDETLNETLGDKNIDLLISICEADLSLIPENLLKVEDLNTNDINDEELEDLKQFNQVYIKFKIKLYHMFISNNDYLWKLFPQLLDQVTEIAFTNNSKVNTYSINELLDKRYIHEAYINQNILDKVDTINKQFVLANVQANDVINSNIYYSFKPSLVQLFKADDVSISYDQDLIFSIDQSNFRTHLTLNELSALVNNKNISIVVSSDDDLGSIIIKTSEILNVLPDITKDILRKDYEDIKSLLSLSRIDRLTIMQREYFNQIFEYATSKYSYNNSLGCSAFHADSIDVHKETINNMAQLVAQIEYLENGNVEKFEKYKEDIIKVYVTYNSDIYQYTTNTQAAKTIIKQMYDVFEKYLVEMGLFDISNTQVFRDNKDNFIAFSENNIMLSNERTSEVLNSMLQEKAKDPITTMFEISSPYTLNDNFNGVYAVYTGGNTQITNYLNKSNNTITMEFKIQDANVEAPIVKRQVKIKDYEVKSIVVEPEQSLYTLNQNLINEFNNDAISSVINNHPELQQVEANFVHIPTMDSEKLLQLGENDSLTVIENDVEEVEESTENTSISNDTEEVFAYTTSVYSQVSHADLNITISQKDDDDEPVGFTAQALNELISTGNNSDTLEFDIRDNYDRSVSCSKVRGYDLYLRNTNKSVDVIDFSKWLVKLLDALLDELDFDEQSYTFNIYDTGYQDTYANAFQLRVEKED